MQTILSFSGSSEVRRTREGGNTTKKVTVTEGKVRRSQYIGTMKTG